jgi:hypothetical protein
MAAMKWRSWLSLGYLLATVLAGCSTASVAPTPLYPHGAVNPSITQANIAQTICISGWTATVRPAVSYTNQVKHNLLQEKGLPDSDAGKFELDHYIPLALGGDPRSIDNLWLQPWGRRARSKEEGSLGAKVASFGMRGIADTGTGTRGNITGLVSSLREVCHPKGTRPRGRAGGMKRPEPVMRR